MPLVAQYVSDSATIADSMDESKATEAVWPQDSCEKLQEAAGAYIYLSGEFLKEAHESKDPAVKNVIWDGSSLESIICQRCKHLRGFLQKLITVDNATASRRSRFN